MQKRNTFLAIFGFMLIFLSGCTQQMTTPGPARTPTNAPQAVTLLKPLGSIPATCTPTPVYFGSHDGGLAIPWIAATPSTSGIIGYLFFAQVEPANKPEYYTPMHTNGKMPGGGATKILWQIQNPSATGEITITGKKLFQSGSIFQQTFVEASSGIPSIVDVPTAGCWRLDLQSGSDQATAIFWVLP